MRFLRRWLGGFALAAIAAFAPVAKAADSPLALTVRVPNGCPEGRALHDEVLRLARIGTDAPHRLTADIAVQELGAAAFSLTLSTRLDGVSGERRFEGSSCQSVLEAAALTLALMLNPEVERPQGVAADEPAASPASTNAPRPSQARTPVVRAQPSSPPGASGPPSELRGTLAVLAGLQAGVLPRPGPEVSAALGLSTRTLGAFLTASYVPARDVRLSGQDAGGRLWAASASLLGCWSALASANTSVGPCAGIELTRVMGRGFGVDEPKDGDIFWASGALGLSGGLRLSSWLELRGTVLGLVPLGHPQVFLEDIGQVHKPGPLLGRAQVGLAVALF